MPQRIVEAEGALLGRCRWLGRLARVLDLSLVWVNERIQFGKPIAKFQAIQHLMAQLASEVAAASAAADLAVEASPSAGRTASPSAFPRRVQARR